MNCSNILRGFAKSYGGNMPEVILPGFTGDWATELARVVREADQHTIIVVDTVTKASLVHMAAERMHKPIKVRLRVASNDDTL